MEIFKPGEVEKINEARTILQDIEDRMLQLSYTNPSMAYSLGKLAGFAHVTKDHLFDVLNVSHAYLHTGLTSVQLHNEKVT